MCVSLRQLQLIKAGKQFINLVLIGLKAVSVEAGNLIKGSLGIGICLTKGGINLSKSAKYFLLAILYYLLLQPKEAKKLLSESWTHLKFSGKDLLSTLVCIGQACPAWLPIFILFVCPPAGVALFIMQILVKYTGLTGILAYGGSAGLLFSDSVEMSKKKERLEQRITQGESLTADEIKELEEARKIHTAWKKLKKELHPFKDNTATFITFLLARVVIEFTAAMLNLMFPGLGEIFQWTAYGLEGASALGLAATRYHYHQKIKAEKKALESEVKPSHSLNHYFPYLPRRLSSSQAT
ncbi:MAG: hypothetical protein KGJ02_00840 [Verrucomicrobiota bacterium]|nr:hypothetical protein [Verrucomicrobiota bacterium]